MTRSRVAAQQSFDDLGTTLYAVTFVVVDLETTGGSPEGSRITEFGAVKVRAERRGRRTTPVTARGGVEKDSSTAA